MLKVGVIGTGIIAREHASAIAAARESVTLVAAADTSPDRLKHFCDTYEIARRYGSAAELIDDPEVELVTVATPPSAHEKAVVAALDAGKYVLCEKPLAQSLAGAERIASAEMRHPGRLSVGYQLRYAPQYRRMLWLIQNGWIGEVESAIVERHSYIPHSTVGNGGWWGTWDVAGGGVLMTQMIHELDILLQALGEPRSVTAAMDTRYTRIEAEDWIDAEVMFGAGRTARCIGSVNSGQMRGGMTIKGSLGTISPGRLALDNSAHEAQAISAVNVALPDTTPPSMTLLSRAKRKIGRKLGAAESDAPTPHALFYRDIARAITASRPLPIPAADAMMSLQLCAGVYQAAITGRKVELPLSAKHESYMGVTNARYDGRTRPKRHVATPLSAMAKSSTVRVGLIGLDTTHAPTFTDLLHNPYNPDHIPGARVVAAFSGGSPDMHISASRVGAFTAELRNRYAVPIMDSPEAVADAADVVLILSSDGRTHPGLFSSVADRGKPIFIDKPFAISTVEAELIYARAEETGAKLFASSAYRYADGLVSGLNAIRASGEKIRSCQIRYWGQVQPTQGRFFWYGIHGAEMLLAVMGKGITAVEARTDGRQDVIEIEHKDGRRSSLIGHHQDGTFEASIETDKRTLDITMGGPVSARLLAALLDILTPGGYPRLWRASAAGSVAGRPGKWLDPDDAETLEVVRLLDAAERSYASRQKIYL